jgi:hypothetical protein
VETINIGFHVNYIRDSRPVRPELAWLPPRATVEPFQGRGPRCDENII